MQRIKRELAEISRATADHKLYHIEMVNNNVHELRGHIFGPPDSPFQGGIFRLEIKIPAMYPFRPPQIRFTTPMWHPNVSSQTGVICLDILNNLNWAASLTLRTVMLSLQALLSSPEPDDPGDGVVAHQCKETPNVYERTAAYWTYVYATEKKNKEAGKSFGDYENLVGDLMKSGSCDRTRAISALSCHCWDLKAALASL